MKITFKWRFAIIIILTILAVGIFIYGFYIRQNENQKTERDIFLRNAMLFEESIRLCTFRNQLGFIRDCMTQTGNWTKCNQESLDYVFGFSNIPIISVNGTVIHWIARCYNLADLNKTADYILETDVASDQLKAEKLAQMLNQSVPIGAPT